MLEQWFEKKRGWRQPRLRFLRTHRISTAFLTASSLTFTNTFSLVMHVRTMNIYSSFLWRFETFTSSPLNMMSPEHNQPPCLRQLAQCALAQTTSPSNRLLKHARYSQSLSILVVFRLRCSSQRA
ncbi:hypothetical protein BU25DRAFT_65949 [Macroventuria anomochaeta]|uniref:Uncharacterized protein n=1 Tax=Macroventuria anomochaeta TaxID=301207 RepID=A0ACB6S0B6_9PLEO|nr:uncharacterized protein BU25DRAFT_65949 [Macroventuria anomochaeta]KAF2627468.1 hypothetical protein BU25DRAFT_65949 [Macroventuria anomochaeta]